jgi:branched-chain amino acid aminotransferase
VTDLVITRGVGVFDSLRGYDRAPFALDEHMKRLEDSALSIGIATGDTVARIRRTIIDGLKRKDCPGGGNTLVKAYITGGDENNYGRFPKPRHFIIFEEAETPNEEEYRTGIALQPTTEARPYPLVKTVNYLVGIMQSAGRDDVKECLYCPGGEITETLRSSFFMCKDNALITAPVGAVLGGVTRNIVIDIARANGLEVDERLPKVSELTQADEAFITGTMKEILPVVRIGDTVIGDGKPGPIAAKLLQLFRDSRARWLTRG